MIGKGIGTMKAFKIFSKDGREGEITIGEVGGDTGCIEVEVIKLKFRSNLIYEDVTAEIAYRMGCNCPLLEFKDKKILALKNQALINYIWEEAKKKGSNNCLGAYARL